MTDRRRVFIGTFLAAPDQERLGRLREYEAQLTEQWQCKLRFVRPEKLHLTWFFIGSVSSAAIDEIRAICAEEARHHGPMQMQFATPTFWPRARGARMLVLQPETVPQPVMQLATALKSRCRKWAEHEDKRYRPHITLMRFDGVDGKQRLELPEFFPLADHLPVSLDVQMISLIESHLGTGGAYETLENFPLI